SHFHALELQLELTRRQIPFDLTSGIRFYEQAHVKDATAYLRLVINPRDEASFKRLVKLFPGVGSKAAEKLWDAFQVQSVERRAQSVPNSPVAHALQGCAEKVPKKAVTAWAQFVPTIAQLEADGVRGNPSAMLNLVLEADYVEHLERNYPNHKSR